MPAVACARQPRAPPFIDPAGYARHRPETTLLYRLLERHYPVFRDMHSMEGRSLPGYVQQEARGVQLHCGC
jgi:hypothetical protein